MPKFVPVADPEARAGSRTRRNWQNIGTSTATSLQGIRPNNETRGRPARATNADEGRANRGFEQGAVGWGVVGTFGSEARDADAQARPPRETKMVQNDKGCGSARRGRRAPSRRRRRGRGRGAARAGRRRRDRSRSRSRAPRRDRSRSAAGPAAAAVALAS